MLTQEDANILLEILKEIKDTQDGFILPSGNECKKIEAVSYDQRHSFIVDVNRKGKINSLKFTLQNRYAGNVILLRLDIGGPPHRNPDGKTICGNHIHIYREGYDTRFAEAIPKEFVNPSNMLSTLYDFLVYCKVTNTDSIDIQSGL